MRTAHASVCKVAPRKQRACMGLDELGRRSVLGGGIVSAPAGGRGETLKLGGKRARLRFLAGGFMDGFGLTMLTARAYVARHNPNADTRGKLADGEGVTEQSTPKASSFALCRTRKKSIPDCTRT